MTQQSSSDTPLARFKATYTPLYRVLLVLGSIAALMSLAGISNLQTIIGYFSSDVFYATSGIITAIIVPLFMISSLILLWNKHPTGIKLRLTGYALSVVATIIGLFTSQRTLTDITKNVLESAESATHVIGPEFATDITEVSFYGSLYVSIGASLLFAWLWWKAWKKQSYRDKKLARTHNTRGDAS